MKCELPDCAERFNAQNKSEYGILRYAPNTFASDGESQPRRKIRICKKCVHRPLREVLHTLLTKNGGPGLSETDIEKIKESNLIIDMERGLIDQ